MSCLEGLLCSVNVQFVHARARLFTRTHSATKGCSDRHSSTSHAPRTINHVVVRFAGDSGTYQLTVTIPVQRAVRNDLSTS